MHEFQRKVLFQADIDEADMWLGELRHQLMERRERGNAGEDFSDYVDKALELELEDKVNMMYCQCCAGSDVFGRTIFTACAAGE